MMDPLAAELEFAKALATEAAEIARSRSRAVTAQEKENLSYVTDLDHDVERLIRDRIAARFPDDQITGEEYAAAGGAGPRRWSIDPIDGTGNLVHQVPIWAVSIGLLDDGEPVLGVIAIPPIGELYWATKDHGAWQDGTRIQAHDAEAFHTQDNVHVSTNANRAIDPRTIPGRLRDFGSACSALAFSANGRMRAGIFLGEQAHDLAAGAVLNAEAGCRFGTIDGRALTPAEFVDATPVRVPTIVAPPRRLAALTAMLRRLNS